MLAKFRKNYRNHDTLDYLVPMIKTKGPLVISMKISPSTKKKKKKTS